jgi:RHH-type rel operon transcriptional repressor/antitoxin RelB
MAGSGKGTISFRLPKRDKDVLDALAATMSRNRSDLIGDAIRSYLDVQRWQIDEIQHSLKEADDGDFASPEEVKRVLGRLSR